MVDNKITVDIIKTGPEKTKVFKEGIRFEETIAEAKSRWIPYTPQKRKCESVGVDGSWNRKSYQGFDVYVVNAIAVDSCNTIVRDVEFEHDSRVARAAYLGNKSLEFESQILRDVLRNNVPDGGLVLQDGAITEWFKSSVFGGSSDAEGFRINEKEGKDKMDILINLSLIHI